MAEKVTYTSWGQRLGNSIKGIPVGMVLVVLAVVLLWWNEGRAVNRIKTLQEGAAAVVSVPNDRVDSANEGKLIHLTGRATTDDIVEDPDFKVSVNAIRLVRDVEMYQWIESESTRTEKTSDGGEKTITTYSYSQGWSDSLHNSSQFNEPGGHENPTSMPYSNATFNAEPVMLGAFTLPGATVDRFDADKPFSVSAEALPAIPNLQPANGGYYIGSNPSAAAVGDLRVQFAIAEPQDISVIAAQRGETLGPYTTSVGGTIDLFAKGVQDSSTMFATARRQNTMLTWALRAGGAFAMFIGLSMIATPLSIVADKVPFIGRMMGNLISAGVAVVAGAFTVAISSTIIALAWLWYRPLFGVLLLLPAILCAVFIATRMFRGPRSSP